jgi:heat shock protein HslJ
VEDLLVQGDLDGDSVEEAAVLLAESSGGSGVMTYLALVTWRDGAPVNLATRLIGDRVQIRSLRVEDGELILDYITAGPEEPACCPTRKVRDRYRLQEGRLVESGSEAMGPMSLQDLQGVTWELTHFGRQNPVPEGVRISLSVDGDRVSGSAGCNRYFGRIREKVPGELAIGPVGSTRMACAEPKMSAERTYLEALEEVVKFGFLNGRLVLSYTPTGADGVDSLRFAPAP